MNQIINIWTLPTAARFLADIRKELSVGISLCVVMPDPESHNEFHKALKYGLEMDECLTVFTLDLSTLEEITLSSVQKEVVGESQIVSLSDFIRVDAPDVILLRGFDQITTTMQRDMIAFMQRWAENCHTNGDLKSLCLIIPGNRAADVQNIRFSTTSSRITIRCLVGVPSALDVQLLSRTHFIGDFFTAEVHWREIIISSLSGNDLELAFLLGQNRLDTYDNIINVLQEYANINAWNRADMEKMLRKWVPLTNGTHPEIPRHAENIKLMWSKITLYTLEHGEEIHPAVLTLLGRDEDIKHRVWRAQTTLVLPVIDELRIKIYFGSPVINGKSRKDVLPSE